MDYLSGELSQPGHELCIRQMAQKNFPIPLTRKEGSMVQCEDNETRQSGLHSNFSLLLPPGLKCPNHKMKRLDWKMKYPFWGFKKKIYYFNLWFYSAVCQSCQSWSLLKISLFSFKIYLLPLKENTGRVIFHERKRSYSPLLNNDRQSI